MFDGDIEKLPYVTHQFFEPCQECIEVEIYKIRFTLKELKDINVEFLKKITLEDLI